MSDLNSLHQFKTLIGNAEKTHENRYRATKYAMKCVERGADASEENIQFFERNASTMGKWVPDHVATQQFTRKHSEWLTKPKTDKSTSATSKKSDLKMALRHLSRAAQLLASHDEILPEQWRVLQHIYSDVIKYCSVADTAAEHDTPADQGITAARKDNAKDK